MSNHKIEKISSEVSRHISYIILTEARDEILKSITITGCDVTTDLSHATIYFTSLLDKTSKDLEKELAEAAPFLRSKLAEVIELRHTPKLKFVYDKSIEYGENIEKIIEQIHQDQK